MDTATRLEEEEVEEEERTSRGNVIRKKMLADCFATEGRTLRNSSSTQRGTPAVSEFRPAGLPQNQRGPRHPAPRSSPITT